MRSLAHKRIERKLYIVSGDGIAVRETRCRIDVKRHRKPVIRQTEIVGDQAIHAERFVEAFLQQTFENQRAKSLRRYALEQVGVEAIECTQAIQRDLTAFLCSRVNIIEMREFGRVLRLVAHSHRGDRPGLGKLQQGKAADK